MTETLASLICGICGADYRELIPWAALKPGRERLLCAAVQLPICLTCEAQAEMMGDGVTS